MCLTSFIARRLRLALIVLLAATAGLLSGFSPCTSGYVRYRGEASQTLCDTSERYRGHFNESIPKDALRHAWSTPEATRLRFQPRATNIGVQRMLWYATTRDISSRSMRSRPMYILCGMCIDGQRVYATRNRANARNMKKEGCTVSRTQRPRCDKCSHEAQRRDKKRQGRR